MEIKLILTGGIVFLTHALEGITGFGSAVLALPFLKILIGLRTSVQLLGILGWVIAFYIVVRSWRHIVWKEFLFIALWVGVGLPVGMWIFDALPAEHLCVLLGAFMVVMGIRGVIQNRKPDCSAIKKIAVSRSIWMRLFLLCGGVLQGAFGTGGPFVVIYAAKAIPDKRVFRVTLSLLWLSMNTVRLLTWFRSGEILNATMGRLLWWCLPVTICGLLLGDYLHNKVCEYHFRIGVYILLAVAGLFMFTGNVLKICG